MIEFTRSYKTSDGNVFATLQLAQAHELIGLMTESGNTGPDGMAIAKDVATVLVDKSKRVVDILTTTERSHPKGRSIHGAVRQRKAPAVLAAKTA